MTSHDSEATAAREALRDLDDYLTTSAATSKPEAIPPLLELRDHLQRKASSKPPYSVSGFLQDDIRPLWPLFYFFFLLLIFVAAPPTARFKGTYRPMLWLLPTLYVLHRWPTWLRNTSLGDTGRRVYNSVNIDISVPAFLVQELQSLLIVAGIACVWTQWLSYDGQCASENAISTDPFDAALDDASTERLMRRFREWTTASLLLSGAFIYYTYFFWHRVAIDHDTRFVAHAILIHLFWAISWLIVSRPLMNTWRQWSLTRLDAIHALRSQTDIEIKLKVLSEARPMSFAAITGVGVLSIVGFVLPILQLFMR